MTCLTCQKFQPPDYCIAYGATVNKHGCDWYVPKYGKWISIDGVSPDDLPAGLYALFDGVDYDIGKYCPSAEWFAMLEGIRSFRSFKKVCPLMEVEDDGH